jgi:hypothetical protein
VDRPVELIPLVCSRCTAPVPAEPGERAWLCSQCGQGLYLDETEGLQGLEIAFAAGIPQAKLGRPFWVTDGQVSVQRETYSSRNSNKDAQTFWSKPQRFFVPAYTCSLEEMVTLGSDLLLRPPAVNPGVPARFLPVTLALADVTSAVEFIVVALEAGRKDKLRRLQLNLQLSPPRLWVLP